MSNSTVYIDIYDPTHTNLLLSAPVFTALDMLLTANTVGQLTVDLDLAYYNYLKDRKHDIIEVWRQVEQAQLYLEGQTVWYIQKVDLAITDRGVKTCRLTAFPAIWICQIRTVVYAANSTQANKSGPLDDVMKAIISDNYGASATDYLGGSGRYLSLLNIQNNLSAAPTGSKAFANRVVYDVLRELAADSYTSGTYLAFDIVATSPGQAGLEFQTFTGQRGSNRSALTGGNNSVILNVEQNSLASANLTEDWTNEATHVYAGGQGLGADRQYTISQDTTRLTTPFRVEKFIDSRQNSLNTSVQADGDAALRAARFRKLLNAPVADGGLYVYGRDYFFGDLVSAEAFGQYYDCRVDSVHLTQNTARTSVQIGLTNG